MGGSKYSIAYLKCSVPFNLLAFSPFSADHGDLSFPKLPLLSNLRTVTIRQYLTYLSYVMLNCPLYAPLRLVGRWFNTNVHVPFLFSIQIHEQIGELSLFVMVKLLQDTKHITPKCDLTA